MQEVWTQIFRMQNQDRKSNRTNCERYIWLGLQHLVQMSLCGEFGHIAMNCVKHHMRKRDTTKRCFICTKLSHLAKNYMNTRRIEDGKKARASNIRK